MQSSKEAAAILELLGKRGESLSLAESCTGGLLANAFVSIEGASEVFLGALVCYSAKAKVSIAGVSEESAFENFAVNESCSKEFALGAMEKFASDFAVSTTGFAEDGKEMYLSIASKAKLLTYRQVFYGDRNEIRDSQVKFALSKLLEFLH